jgi:hypothetical protein
MRKLVHMWLPHQAPEWFRRALPENYPMEIYDPEKDYDLDTVFYYDLHGDYRETIATYLERGHRVVLDAKNEHYIQFHFHWAFLLLLQYPGQGMILISGDGAKQIPGLRIEATPYWYWILDQPRLQEIGLDQYQPNPRREKKFFMSLGKTRVFRDYLYDGLGDLLQDSVHSYLGRDLSLPNDWKQNMNMGGSFDRYVNADWLDTTCFTLAVETYVDDSDISGFSLTQNDQHFLCEKTYKPLACKHPLLMVSTQGNLAHLRNQGFETYPELWDESYDDITDWKTRIDRIIQIVRDFDTRGLDIPTVQEKLLHNSARFFDKGLTTQLLNSTVINPLLEFVNA